MKTRYFTFKFSNPNFKYGEITYYGFLTVNFSEDLDIRTEKYINNILKKVSETIKKQIKDNYAKKHGYNTKTKSFWTEKHEDIFLFHFEPKHFNPFRDDPIYAIIETITINKAFLNYCDLEVE